MKASLRMVAAAAALVALTVPHPILAAGTQASKGSPPSTAAAKAADGRARVAARAAALDDWATALTVEMNKATGQAKIDAMARLLARTAPRPSRHDNATGHSTCRPRCVASKMVEASQLCVM